MLLKDKDSDNNTRNRPYRNIAPRYERNGKAVAG